MELEHTPDAASTLDGLPMRVVAAVRATSGFKPSDEIFFYTDFMHGRACAEYVLVDAALAHAADENGSARGKMILHTGV